MRQKSAEMKIRLDELIVARGLAESRTAAQRLILAGKIRVKDCINPKSGNRYDSEIEIEDEFDGRPPAEPESPVIHERAPEFSVPAEDCPGSSANQDGAPESSVPAGVGPEISEAAEGAPESSVPAGVGPEFSLVEEVAQQPSRDQSDAPNEHEDTE